MRLFPRKRPIVIHEAPKQTAGEVRRFCVNVEVRNVAGAHDLFRLEVRLSDTPHPKAIQELMEAIETISDIVRPGINDAKALEPEELALREEELDVPTFVRRKPNNL